jgi:hypothetical protein
MRIATPPAARILLVTTLMFATAISGAQGASPNTFLGFDRNDYPGDALLPALHKSFRYTSFWLNNPPGETANSWEGKHGILQQNGFGFLVLFNGRLDAQLRGKSAAALGTADGRDAAAAALRAGFARNVLIFLDQEEGGRLLPEQVDYIFAWIDAVRAAGARAGVYCSGIEVRDESGPVSTALDIVERERARAKNSSKDEEHRLALWIANDACPPAPGCTLASPPLAAAVPAQLRPFTAVWQYAQSPRRMEFSAKCASNAAPDGNCYAPGLPASASTFLDLDVANSPDPSEGP